MKIGITCYPSMGGSGIIATELGIKLAERGHEVHFITSNIPFRIRKPLPNMIFHQVEVNQYAVFQYPPYDITLSTKIALKLLKNMILICCICTMLYLMQFVEF